MIEDWDKEGETARKGGDAEEVNWSGDGDGRRVREMKGCMSDGGNMGDAEREIGGTIES